VGKDPPIVELALTLTFTELAGPTVVDLANLYSAFQGQYPTIQHQPQLAPMNAVPGPAVVQVSPVGVEVPRLWFISHDTRDLVQFQPDRVSQNWRRIGPFSDRIEYPGYEAVRSRFVEAFLRVEAWARERGVPSLSLATAELVYVNAFPLRRADDEIRLSEVISFYKPPVPARIFNLHMNWFEAVPEIEGGRVIVAFSPGQLPDGPQALNLTMTGRCAVRGMDVTEALARLDVLHDNIHTIFARVLTPEITEGFRR